MVGALDLISVGSWKWVGESVVNEVDGINGIFVGIQRLIGEHTLYTDLIGKIPQGFKDAVGGVALTLISLFLLIDFVKKSTDLKWVTWENVLMFFIKFIFAKVFVENAGWVMSCIYNGFSSLTNELLNVTRKYSSDETVNQLLADWCGWLENSLGLKTEVPYLPLIEGDNKTIYSYFLNSGDVNRVLNNSDVGFFDFTPVGVWLLVVIQGLITKGILAVTFIIILARFMELAIYTVAAPLPLATLGSDGLQDIGKSYLKSYAACCVHAIVILLIFCSWQALNTISLDGGAFFDMFKAGGFYGLIKTFVLGATIMKSEQWAKRICGAI